MWFFEELNEVENIVFIIELVFKGEMIRMNIDFIFIVFEVGVGYRIVFMFLAKLRFLGEGKNWSILINFYC